LKAHDLKRLAAHRRQARQPQRIASGKKAKRQIVSALGVKGEKEWADQGIRTHGAGFYDASESKLFASRERKNCEGVYTNEMAPYNLVSLLIAEDAEGEEGSAGDL
jgi:hypothetical protein